MYQAQDHAALVFAPKAETALGHAIARHLNQPLANLEERDFEDGEHKTRPLENVRDRDVYVVHSLYADKHQTVNDKLVRLLFFLGALRDAGAGRITAVVPYLCYARKDRKTKTRDPITTRYLAQLFEAVGCDRVAVMDVHNIAAFQNAFRCPTEHLLAAGLFVRYFADLPAIKAPVVVSPDAGGMKRARAFRDRLEAELGIPVPLAFMEKERSGGQLSGGLVVGEIHHRQAIILDDLISTGGTLRLAAQALREQGAEKVFAAATHGLFMSAANTQLAGGELDGIVVTNTVRPSKLENPVVMAKIETLDVAPLLADAIARMHSGGSLVELMAQSR
ncbi:MAG: ribose-phosphate pyrophosphokinase [Pseudomonadota bacterium]|nr:ribose-phosphate pyrophosphokinase [Pseudomonadota bacterium]